MTVALAIATAIIAGLALAFFTRLIVTRHLSPRTRALTELVDAWRFGDEPRREAAFDGIAAAFGLDAPDIAPAERRDRHARLIATAGQFDQRYGAYHWGVRTEALVAGRWPPPKP